MKVDMVLPIIFISSFLVAGCTDGGTLFLQSLKKTAPKSEQVVSGPTFAPVKEEFVDLYGIILTTQNGKPLYTYTKDSVQSSSCYGECAIIWPPFLVDFEQDVGGLYGVIERTDGNLQVTYNGMPLYTYTPDSPYEVTGDGKDGDWNVVLVPDSE